MLKTISAALIAVSVLAAPAMAAGTDQKTPAPVTKSTEVTKSTQMTKTSEVKPVAKPTQVKASVLNANAKMGRHHRHARHMRHHRRHVR